RLDLALKGADLGLWDLDVQTGQAVVNERAANMAGYSLDEIDQTLSFILNLIHPDDRSPAMDQLDTCFKGQTELYEVEYRLLAKSGEWKWVLSRGKVVERDANGSPLRMTGTFMDVTDRKKAEQELRRLNRELDAVRSCNQILIRAEDEQTLLNDVCRIICDKAGYRLIWIGYAENDDAKTVRPVAWAGVEDGYLATANITWADTERGQGPAGRAIRSGETVYVEDFTTDPRMIPWRDKALQNGYRSAIALPLKDECANVFGALLIYASESNAITPSEIRLMEELAADLAFGINGLRTRIERKRAEDALRESEKKVRRKLDAILAPETDIEVLELSDIIDSEKIQKLMDEFYRLTNVGIGIIDLHGNVLVGTGWQDVCTKFHRVNPESCRLCIESDLELSREVPVGTFKQYKCKNNMWDIATPIMLGDKHVGNIFLGQFLFDEEIPDKEIFRQQARRYGFNEEEYLAALDRVPRWSQQKVDAAMSFYAVFAAMIGNLSYSNVKLANALEERKRAEQERLAHLRFFESMDRVNRAIQGANDLEQMMSDVLDIVLSVFDCDRAFLMYPCDPQAVSWASPMERTKPEYHGVLALGLKMPMDAEVAKTLRILLDADGPVKFGPGTPYPLPQHESERFGFKCFMSMALQPKVGNSWQFGIHQCSYARVWTQEEERLLKEIGRRLADGLSTLLSYRNLLDSMGKLEEAQRIGHIGYWDRVIAGNQVTLAGEACRIFGISEQESVFNLEQWQERWLTLIHPEDLERVNQVYVEAMGSGPRYNVEYRIVRPDGEVRHIHSEANVTRDESGHAIRMVGMMQDITEQKSLQSQLFQAQKMEAIGTLAGGIAHDFNNILQVALGYSELILSYDDLPKRCQADLHKIRESARRGADLVKRLLTFSRKTEIKPQPLNLNRRIHEMRKMLERTIPKMIEIQLVLDENLATINADPTQVDQILMNLALNARDAMPDGGRLIFETANVVLDAEYASSHLDARLGDHVLLSITDSGVGMDKETLPHIFEPFYTTKGMGKGTGLGLAMVHGIVQQHGGHIRCYSEPGQGTGFKIYFPALVADEELEERTAAAIPLGGSETILLADDEEFVRDLGQRLLSEQGYKVLTASNGKEALEVYRSQSAEISLVILDLVMPEMGGKQCLRGLLEINPKAKVLIASGFSANGPTKDALVYGAKGFVDKPFSLNQLIKAVRETLDNA
ncbi:MAG: PocR ligand-binding domain-containing protein, partial [Candidatus Marsarchaeota archaeon]|nr:PocR ligand-binding domain-containing protein [Candidatus Marsarchaeota archaeon]